MRRVIFIAMLVIVALPAVADEERVITADTGFRLTYGSSGPPSIDVALDGDATIKFMWLQGGLGVGAGTVIRAEPVGTTGNSTAFALRNTYPPRNFEFGADGPDSCYVDVDTATEVIVSW